MRIISTFISITLLMLTAHAESLNYEPEPELLYHTAPPGMNVMPRSDVSQMVMAYDVTLIPREDKDEAYFRWGRLDENGEGASLWTKWREYDEVVTFSTPGRYVLETRAQAIGKDVSVTLKVTFRVDYLGMTMSPGIMLTPFEQRGYYASLYSPYDEYIYYRWKHYDLDVWSKWRLYTEPIPFTEAGQYVLDADCKGDPLSIYIEVPSVDYVKPGDVDYNGTVNIQDVTALINMLLNGYIIGTGDVNKDGKVNISDVTTLINLLLGMER